MSIQNYPLISPIRFKALMSEHWATKLNNVVNEDFLQTWEQMAATFGQAIMESHKTTQRHWRVIQPATGTGKTQGLCLYLSELIKENDKPNVAPVGSLIVVRQIEQAEDEVRSTIINHLGDDERFAKRVITHHSKAPKSPEDISKADIVIITHAQYLACIDQTTTNYEAVSDRWKAIIKWKPRGQSEAVNRRLTVIDEALDIVRHDKISADDIKRTLGNIPEHIAIKHPETTDLIKQLVSVFTDVTQMKKNKGHTMWDKREALEYFPDWCEMSPLIEDLIGLPHATFSDWIGKKNDEVVGRNIKSKVVSNIQSIQKILSQWSFYFHKGKDGSFNHSDLAVPLDLINPVLLDATANHSALLKLFGSNVDIKPIPANPRRYDNVTIRTATPDGGTGKYAMLKDAANRGKLLFDSLNKEVPIGSNVLIICHKDIKKDIEGYKIKSSNYEVAHFGDLDGKNKWRDFDTVVLFGVYNKPQDFSIASYFAAIGGPDDEVFNGPKEAGGYNDIIKAINFGDRMTTTIQAINRIRCRQVIDEQGNCPSANIFITLPPKDHVEVLETIKKDMPGINIGEPWDMSFGVIAKSRRANYEKPLLTLMEELPRGKHTASYIKKQLSMNDKQWKNLAYRKLSKPNDSLSIALASLKVRYLVDGKRSFLLKT